MTAPKHGQNCPSSFSPDYDGLAAFLRRLHPNSTRFAVAADTGLPADTVRNWLERRSGMRLEHFWALVSAYGPQVIAALWPGSAFDWLTAAQVAEAEAAMIADIKRRKGMLADLRAKRAVVPKAQSKWKHAVGPHAHMPKDDGAAR
ncbi:MAG: hypothetical protein AAF739_00425 [Pseudomonadota bacterium]